MNLEPLPPPEADPRQHTLFKFFKPARSSLAHPTPNNAVKTAGNNFQAHDLGPACPIGTETNSPSSQPTDTDADMDTEISSGSDESAQARKWIGGLGWM